MKNINVNKLIYLLKLKNKTFYNFNINIGKKIIKYRNII